MNHSSEVAASVAQPLLRSKELLRTCWNRWLILAGCGISLVTAGSVEAESIWERRNPEHAFLFYDSKARAPGDLLTILISQDTALDHREDRGLKKSSAMSSIFELAAKAGGGFGPHAADSALDLTGDARRQFQGAESFRSQQALTDRVTVTVMEVLPNGNLVLSGRRRIRISGEERDMQISGIARPIDIGPDNSISSRHVADLEITYEAVGASQRFTRQGWMDRGLNRFWPF